MIYAGILAAGLGKRMHRQDLPKQFLPLGEKPIIIHTIEQFLINNRIGRVIIVAPKIWCGYVEDLLTQYPNMGKGIDVICGGENKTESIKYVVDFIKNTHSVTNEDILLAHDAIRPFVTQRIINDNIDATIAYGAANTSMVTNDAVMVSRDGKNLDSMPPHEMMYAEQTPQTYNIVKLTEVLENAVAVGTDLTKISELPRLYIESGNKMRLVSGEYFNMKIAVNRCPLYFLVFKMSQGFFPQRCLLIGDDEVFFKTAGSHGKLSFLNCYSFFCFHHTIMTPYGQTSSFPY